MAERTIQVSKTITTCDLCGNDRSGFIECSICGKTVCRKCRAWNHCIDCWEKNEYYANVEIIEKADDAYDGRNNTVLRLVPESPVKLNNLLQKFAGKRIKLSVEVIKTKEELYKEKRQKQLEGDDPTKWLERCG